MKKYRVLTTVCAALIVWQSIILLFNLPGYILPSPWRVVKELYNHSILIFENSLPTALEAIAGFFLSVLLGCSSALILIFSRPARTWFLPILLASQALPVFVIAPVLVLWLGYGMASKILTCTVMLFFPITSAFYDGLRQTPKSLLELANVMQATRLKTLRHIQIPAALPHLASGLRMAAVFAPMSAVIGEWVGSSQGLGYLILNSNARMQIDLMFAALIALIVLAVCFYYAVNLSLRWINW